MLVAGKLNLVGEFHSESDARRDEEKRFCLAKVHRPDYWVEHQFPDVYEGGQLANLPGAGEADLMEYRGPHGVAMAIEKFEKLGNDAVNVSATPISSAAGAVSAFTGQVKEVVTFAANVKKRSRLSMTSEVNAAVQAVYTEVANACRAYTDAIRDAPLDKQLVAVRTLANSRIAVRDRVAAVSGAVGANLTDDRDAAELAKCMRKRRSTFMGVGAEKSGLIGVWKVGNGHITDLTDGTAKVAFQRVNIVTRDEFNAELDAWRSQ